jgi:hypothetical protein
MSRRIRKFADDPGIAEVRRWRASLVKDAGGTLKGFLQFLRDSEARRKRGGRAQPARRRKSA